MIMMKINKSKSWNWKVQKNILINKCQQGYKKMVEMEIMQIIKKTITSKSSMIKDKWTIQKIKSMNKIMKIMKSKKKNENLK